ncbi:MAG TPA: class V aminotransferase [Caulobacteraceae bacterium]
MSYKRLFSRALAAAPERLHMAAHSHHLWPDVTRDAQLEYWEDSARHADRKWDRIFGEVWPEAQKHVARELELPSHDTVVFAPNTHDLLVRLVSAVERKPVRILSTDGEFHSFRRQAARWSETADFSVELVPTEPFDDFPERFAERAREGRYDLIFVSHVFFQSGGVYDRVLELAELSKPEGPWLVVDGYHAFMATPATLGPAADRAFYLGGGYKYAMAGGGAAFLHAPPGFGPRPAITGWFAEFGALTAPPGGVGYSADAGRFLGATFDSSPLYRFNAVRRMLDAEGLTTAGVSSHVHPLLDDLLDRVSDGQAGRLRSARVLNPPGDGGRARFAAFRHPQAALWHSLLKDAGVITDVRGHVLRVGLGLYHDAKDIERFCAVCRDVLGD